jgi:hypothetical protein
MELLARSFPAPNIPDADIVKEEPQPELSRVLRSIAERARQEITKQTYPVRL